MTLFRIVTDDPASHSGRAVFDEPFAPSIAGVAAPSGWTAQLAESLGAEIGGTVEAGPPVMTDGAYGVPMAHSDDATIPETLLYQGVETVSAGFTVDCDRPVTGTFISWTSTSFGGVACGEVTVSPERLARLARQYCPQTPPSS